MEKQSSRGQRSTWNPGDFDFAGRSLSISAKVLASSAPGEEEKRETSPKTSRSTAEKRTGLSTLLQSERKASRYQTGNARVLAAAERSRRAEEEGSDRRVLLPEQKLRILWNNGGNYPCVGRIWYARGARGDPRFYMSGLWEEIYGEKEHDTVSVEKPLGVD